MSLSSRCLLPLAVILSFAAASKLDLTVMLEDAIPQGLDEFMTHRPNFEAISCHKCKSMLNEVISGLNNTTAASASNTKIHLIDLCNQYVPHVGYSKAILCNLMVKTYFSKIQTFARKGYLQDLCIYMTFCPARKGYSPPVVLGTSGRNSKLHGGIDMSDSLNWRNNNRREPLTFVQISDVHMDSAYLEGSPSSCSYKICCKRGITGKGAAGRFGDYRCDAVEETVNLLFDDIKRLDPPPDFFVYVGDSSPHSNGVETLEVKLEDNHVVNEMILGHFRSIGPIFPTIGNHEMYPESIYNRRTMDSQAILASVAKLWPDLFLVPGDQMENIRKHAFYTVLVKPGLRIMSTNSLNSYTLNLQAFWSLFDPVRKEQQLFIRSTLENAKRNNEKVIHISHIKPSHTQTFSGYVRFWEQINEEFGDIIILQLFGHEHADNFVLSTSRRDRSKATGVFLAAPSITPYVYYNRGTNPSYRVFKLDPDTFAPLDYDQYYMDLKKSNEENQVSVQKHYTFTEEYNVPDLSPSSFKTVIERLESNYEDFQRFERNYDVVSNHRQKCARWNIVCRRFLTCEPKAATYLRFVLCLLGASSSTTWP